MIDGISPVFVQDHKLQIWISGSKLRGLFVICASYNFLPPLIAVLSSTYKFLLVAKTAFPAKIGDKRHLQ